MIQSLSDWVALLGHKITTFTILQKLFYAEVKFLQDSAKGQLTAIMPLDIVSIMKQLELFEIMNFVPGVDSKIDISEVYRTGKFRAILTHFPNLILPSTGIKNRPVLSEILEKCSNSECDEILNQISLGAEVREGAIISKISSEKQKIERSESENEKVKKIEKDISCLKPEKAQDNSNTRQSFKIKMTRKKIKIIYQEVANFHTLVFLLLNHIENEREKASAKLQPEIPPDNITFQELASQPSISAPIKGRSLPPNLATKSYHQILPLNLHNMSNIIHTNQKPTLIQPKLAFS